MVFQKGWIGDDLIKEKNVAGFYQRDWNDENGFRVCRTCNISKPFSDFYLRKNGSPNGKVCISCRREFNRKHSMLPEKRSIRLERLKVYNEKMKLENSTYQREYYDSKKGRAKSMLKTAKRRSSKFNEVCELDEDFILKLLESDVCKVTGIPFQYSKTEGMKCNPYSPSLDRICSNTGYTKENVRVVIWQYNLMKGELLDEEVFEICRRVLENATN